MFLAELYPATLELVLTIQEDFCWENLYRPFGARSLLGALNPRLAKPRPGLNSDRCSAALFRDHVSGVRLIEKGLSALVTLRHLKDS